MLQGRNHTVLLIHSRCVSFLKPLLMHSFAVVLIFSLARIIVVQIVSCVRRRDKAGQENEPDAAPAIADNIAQEVPLVALADNDIQDHDDLEIAVKSPANEREMPPTPLEKQNNLNESTNENKPPELLDGLRALVDKAQMVCTAPSFLNSRSPHLF